MLPKISPSKRTTNKNQKRKNEENNNLNGNKSMQWPSAHGERYVDDDDVV